MGPEEEGEGEGRGLGEWRKVIVKVKENLEGEIQALFMCYGTESNRGSWVMIFGFTSWTFQSENRRVKEIQQGNLREIGASDTEQRGRPVTEEQLLRSVKMFLCNDIEDPISLLHCQARETNAKCRSQDVSWSVYFERSEKIHLFLKQTPTNE